LIKAVDVRQQGLLEPFTYTVGNTGKDFRGKLIAAFNEWLKVPLQELAIITMIVDMLHTASLM